MKWEFQSDKSQPNRRQFEEFRNFKNNDFEEEKSLSDDINQPVDQDRVETRVYNDENDQNTATLEDSQTKITTSDNLLKKEMIIQEKLPYLDYSLRSSITMMSPDKPDFFCVCN